MTKQDILKKVLKLQSIFHEGKIPTLPQHEVHPDLDLSSRENYLYFTLPPCINFQRSSPAMWQAALKTWNDPQTNYLFFPEKVALKTREEIQKDLLKHKFALQLNKHTDIWMIISKTLHEYYEDDPRNVLQSTIKLGLVEKIVTPQVVEKLWFELLKDSPISPVEMHPVLWNWSRNNFQPEV